VATHECVPYEGQYVCNTYNNCSGGYYSAGYSEAGSSCYYGTATTTCGYQDVCTQYAKK
jgi:hypothetical protein